MACGVRGPTRSAQLEAALVGLWREYKEHGDEKLRERLILRYSPLVKYVAGRVGVGLPPNIEQSDLVSYGTPTGTDDDDPPGGRRPTDRRRPLGSTWLRAVTAPPSRQVVSAFGGRGEATLLCGGQGRTWAATDLVLKRADDIAEADWLADVLSELPADGFRVNRPVRSSDDGWVLDGWTAWRRLDGTHDTSASVWPQVLEVADRFNAALRGVPRPALLDTRTDRWSVGDRVAFGERPLQVADPVLTGLAARLTAHVVPESAPSQVVHGDLTANVLFAAGLQPAVIDVVPYWRPAGFARAVVVADAVCWHDAPARLEQAETPSLVARAGLYRLVTSDLYAVDLPAERRCGYLADNREAYRRLVESLEAG